MMNASTRANIGLLAMVLTACGESDQPPGVQVADSAGILVYTLASLPPWDAPEYHWRLLPERSIPTGGGSPASEPLLYQPQAYARLSDGTLVVLDGGEFRLVIVDPARDSVLRRFGPSGQGPGEIWSSNSTIWSADERSFWVLDPGNRRLSRFDVEDGLQEERSVTIPGMGGVAFQNPVDHLPWFWKMFLENPEERTLTDSIGRLDMASLRVEYLAPLPPRVESRRSSTGAPAELFAPIGWFAPIGTGGVVSGRNDAGEFRRYSDEGELIGLIRVPMRRARIPESLKPALLEEAYGVMAGEVSSSMPQREVGDWYRLYDLMWGIEDSLFVLQQSRHSTPAGEAAIPHDQVVWRAFSAGGEYGGSVVLPPGVAQPYWIEPGRVIATHRDEFGVATIVIYELHPPEG